MSNPLRSSTVYLTIAQLEAQPGQPLPRYAIPLDRPVLYAWDPGGTNTVDHKRVLGHVGGTLGCWNEVRFSDRGSDLTNANVSVDVADGVWHVLPDGTLSTARIATLVSAGAALGDEHEFTLLDDSANTYTLANGGTSGGNVFVKPTGEKAFVRVCFDGTDWILRSASTL